MQLLRVVLLIAVATFTSESQSHATEVVTNEVMAVHLPLEAAVAMAVVVARVRIEQRRPLLYAGNEICGYAYTARVISGLKGGGQSYEFVMSDDADFKGYGTDYLIIAFRHRDVDPQTQRFIFEDLSSLEADRISCRRRVDYYVPGGFQTLWAFDPESARTFGGEWLAPTARPAIIWCSTGAQMNAASALFRMRDKQTANGMARVIDWSSARDLIVRALGNSPYLSGGQPDPSFKSGAC